MALVTWGGDRLRIETHWANGGQITQEGLSAGRSEKQGQNTVGQGVRLPPYLLEEFIPGHLPAYIMTGVTLHLVCVPQFSHLCSERSRPTVRFSEWGSLHCGSAKTSTSRAKILCGIATPNHQIGKLRLWKAKWTQQTL